MHVPVAQLDRVLVCETNGWRFEPSRVHTYCEFDLPAKAVALATAGGFSVGAHYREGWPSGLWRSLRKRVGAIPQRFKSSTLRLRSLKLAPADTVRQIAKARYVRFIQKTQSAK